MHIIKIVSKIALGILIFSTFLTIANASSESLLINEVMINPSGADLGYEWIELYNASSSAINLNGVSFQTAGKNFVDSFTINRDVYVEPSTYLLICEEEIEGCDLYISKIGLQNGGAESDGLRVVKKPDLIFDTILYDSPNTNMLVDDTGKVGNDNTCAEVPRENMTLGRLSSIDTDDSAKDFFKLDKPTPGEDNHYGYYQNNIRISEISTEQDFVEFYIYTIQNYADWYIKTLKSSSEKLYLTGFISFPLYSIDLELEEEGCVYLYSPDNIIRDYSCADDLQSSSWCTLELPPTSTSTFTMCNQTRNEKNTGFSPKIYTVRDYIVNATSSEIYYLDVCKTVEVDGHSVLNDDSGGLLVDSYDLESDCNVIGVAKIDNKNFIKDFVTSTARTISPNKLTADLANYGYYSANGTVYSFNKKLYLKVNNDFYLLGNYETVKAGDNVDVSGIIYTYSYKSSGLPKYKFYIVHVKNATKIEGDFYLSNSSGPNLGKIVILLSLIAEFFLFTNFYYFDRLKHLTINICIWKKRQIKHQTKP